MKYGKGNLMVVDVKTENAALPEPPPDVPHQRDRLRGTGTEPLQLQQPVWRLPAVQRPWPGDRGGTRKDRAGPQQEREARRASCRLGSYKNTWVFKQVEAVLASFGHDLNTPIEEMDDAVLVALLNGLDEPLKVDQLDRA